MRWVLLVPADAEVDIRRGASVSEPILTDEDTILAVATTAVEMHAQGLPVDVGALLVARVKGQGAEPPRRPPTAVGALFADDPQPVSEPPPAYGCTCGRMYGSELKLREHQRGCGTHQRGALIPKESRITAEDLAGQ